MQYPQEEHNDDAEQALRKKPLSVTGKDLIGH